MVETKKPVVLGSPTQPLPRGGYAQRHWHREGDPNLIVTLVAELQRPSGATLKVEVVQREHCQPTLRLTFWKGGRVCTTNRFELSELPALEMAITAVRDAAAGRNDDE